jgi:hypothetical protein
MSMLGEDLKLDQVDVATASLIVVEVVAIVLLEKGVSSCRGVAARKTPWKPSTSLAG